MHSKPGLALKVLEVLAAEVRTARHATQDLRPIEPPPDAASIDAPASRLRNSPHAV
jgi:hypothetical protein